METEEQRRKRLGLPADNGWSTHVKYDSSDLGTWSWQDYVDGGPDLNSDQIKLAKLERKITKWSKNNGHLSLDSAQGILLEKDLLYIKKLKLGRLTLTRDEKIVLNKMWKRYE